jgi:hypothetical protein
MKDWTVKKKDSDQQGDLEVHPMSPRGHRDDLIQPCWVTVLSYGYQGLIYESTSIRV